MIKLQIMNELILEVIELYLEIIPMLMKKLVIFKRGNSSVKIDKKICKLQDKIKTIENIIDYKTKLK